MTVDVDYELNWNKENIPLTGHKKERCVRFNSSSKRVVLSELDGCTSKKTDTPKKRYQSNAKPTVTPDQVSDHDIECEKEKWAKIALTLSCDQENNEEQIMQEVLSLCSWYDEYEKSISMPARNTGHSSCDLSDQYSEDDDDDQVFLSYIRSNKQSIVGSSGSVKKLDLSSYFHQPNSSTNNTNDADGNELHLSSLRLRSSLSRFDSFKLAFNGTIKNTNDNDSVHNSTQAFSSKNVDSTDPLKGIKSNNSLSLEKAFYGIVDEDNDNRIQSSYQMNGASQSVLSNDTLKKNLRSDSSHLYENKQVKSAADHDFWLDVEFS
ncbi:unnamed protein product [Anisakis simplex]|uniref:Protein TSSC4 n=1 Tax=Anisakis simplex TaxID=6269 RepID=A0A0M3K5R2_ANISI|nr:unnamed protein product [Anisakis simplex]